MGWFDRTKKEPGWVVIEVEDDRISLVHGRSDSAGRAEVLQYSVHPLRDNVALEGIAKDFALDRYKCATLLRPKDYQLLLVDSPNVPREELKTAIRWRIKDQLDYHVDDATVDLLDIPVPKDGPSRNHSMYVVAARNETIQSCVKRFDEAKVPLSVIDIQETAQRNIAALYQDSDRGVAMLHFGDAGGLLTINYQSELVLARRLDISAEQLAEGAREQPNELELFGRIQLELQRTFDHFERQFTWITLSRLLLGPGPAESGLSTYLADALGMPVQQVDLQDILGFPEGGMNPDLQSNLFYLVGSTLRNETAVL
jgi:MSHA biogenesis protein MshI